MRVDGNVGVLIVCGLDIIGFKCSMGFEKTVEDRSDYVHKNLSKNIFLKINESQSIRCNIKTLKNTCDR